MMGRMTTDSSPWLDAEQQRIWRQWLLATTRLQACLARQLQQESGTSMSDFQVLVQLTEAEGGRVRIVQLAETVQWERSRLSHQLTRMEKRGLISRQECPEDGRGAYAVVTDEGRRLTERAAPGHARLVMALMFDALSPEEVTALDTLTAGLLERTQDPAG